MTAMITLSTHVLSFFHLSKLRNYVEMLRFLLETQGIYLFKQRREMIRTLLQLCRRAPIRLLAQCRQKIREHLQCAIDRRLLQNVFLSKSLENYLLIDELNSFVHLPTSQRLFVLIEESMIDVKSTVINSSSTLSNKSYSISSFNELCA